MPSASASMCARFTTPCSNSARCRYPCCRPASSASSPRGGGVPTLTWSNWWCLGLKCRLYVTQGRLYETLDVVGWNRCCAVHRGGSGCARSGDAGKQPAAEDGFVQCGCQNQGPDG